MALKHKIEIVTIILEVVFKKFKRGTFFSFLTETAKIEKKRKAKKVFLKAQHATFKVGA